MLSAIPTESPQYYAAIAATFRTGEEITAHYRSRKVSYLYHVVSSTGKRLYSRVVTGLSRTDCDRHARTRETRAVRYVRKGEATRADLENPNICGEITHDAQVINREWFEVYYNYFDGHLYDDDLSL